MDSLTKINLHIFKTLMDDLGSDFMAEMVETYCDDSSQQLQLLQTAYEQNDSISFTRAAHSLKSTSLTFGAVAFSNLARDLEMLGRAGNLVDAGQRIQQLMDSNIILHKGLRDLCNA